MKFKHCNRCLVDFPIDCFYPHRLAPDGLDYNCKACKKRRVQEWRVLQRSPEHQAELERRQREHADRLVAVEASHQRVEREASPKRFQDAFVFIERKPMFRGLVDSYLRKPTKKFSWRAA